MKSTQQKKPAAKWVPALVILLISIVLTPAAVSHAREFRGYDAVGGEALIIPMGLFGAFCWVATHDEREAERKKHNDRKETSRAYPSRNIVG